MYEVSKLLQWVKMTPPLEQVGLTHETEQIWIKDVSREYDDL